MYKSALLVLLLCCTGCAAGMAASHQPDTGRLSTVSRIRMFESRYAVLAALGPPYRTHIDDAGQRIDFYSIQQGDRTAAGRARMHAGLSGLTLGTWDVIGVPLELLLADPPSVLHLQLTYDTQEVLVNIQTAP